MSEIIKKNLSEIIDLIKKKEIKSEELANLYINKVNKSKKLNSYITTCFEHTIQKSKEFDKKPNLNTLLPGVPLAVKDLFCTNGFKTTAEYAMGSSNETSYFGNVINPIAKDTVPGGSSGGSASALAADLTPATIGTDTGGSIRQPASFTGTVGLKPTYGLCSRWGIVAFASSLDQAGPMTKSVKDCSIMLEAMAGFDKKDSTSIEKKKENYSKNLKTDIKGLKIGIPKEYRVENMPKEIDELWNKGKSILKDLGADIIDISLPHTTYALPTYYIVAPAEASSNLARYDGVKYGFRSKGDNLIDMYEKTRSEGFGSEVQRRIMIGTYVLSSGYYDAYYLKAQKVRNLIKNDFDEAYKKVDAILTPSTPSSAFKIGEKKDDPVSMKKGYPLGLQIIGKAFDEQNILNIAYSMEEKINFKNKIADWWIK